MANLGGYSSLISIPAQVWNLLLSGVDYNRERVLRQLAQANQEFRRFYEILRDPSTGIRHRNEREAVKNYLLILLPLVLIAAAILVLVNLLKIDFLEAGLIVYAVTLCQVPLVLLFARRLIPQEIYRIQGRALGEGPGNKLLVRLFHLKLFLQYGLLIALGVLAAALKTLVASPGALFQAISLLQDLVFDVGLGLVAAVLLVAPLWLLRRAQVNSIRRIESILFERYFGPNNPRVELTIDRKLGIEKVWGSIVSISDRIILSRPDGYIESFSWSKVVGIAALRDQDMQL